MTLLEPSSPSHSGMPKTKTRVAFREWLESQTRWPHARDLARDTGIPYNTLRGYLSGKLPSPTNAETIRELTGFKRFAIAPGGERRRVTRAVIGISLDARIELFRNLVRGLNVLMDSFHNGSRSDRERLRSELREEIGRFHLLVRALASERSRRMVLEEGGGDHGNGPES